MLLVGCTPGLGSGTLLGGDVASLRVEPSEVELDTRSGQPVEQAFTAIATFSDGTEDELPLVSWELSNASAGTVDSRGNFKSVDTNGGEATVTATFLEHTAEASISLTHSAEYIEEGADAAGAAALGKVDDGEGGLTITYPFDDTTVPRNLEGLEVEWTGSQTTDLIRIHFASALESVDVYTTGSKAWEVPVEVWEAVSATNRRGSLSLQIYAASWDGNELGPVKSSEPIDVTVNRFDTAGSVLYWSASDTAIMRIIAGGGTAARFYPKTPTGQCYGCHEVAEGEQWMVVTRDGVGGTYQVIDVADPAAPAVRNDTDDRQRMTFHALSPDGKWMLGVLNGDLVLYDLATNRFVSTVTPDSGYYTHPGWSPDGERVVATRATGSVLSDMSVNGSEVVTMYFDGSKLLDKETLIPATPGTCYYYPSFSPDGDWIVYNKSTGDTYADDDAEVWLISASGGDPIRLDAANSEGRLRNSLARWAPLPDDDVLWLAFSSKRDRGSHPARFSQIWITAIQPDLASSGQDASSAPYWLPGQNENSDNHLPVWWSQ